MATKPSQADRSLSPEKARSRGGMPSGGSYAATLRFSSRLFVAKVAELKQPRRHPKAFGIPFTYCPGPLRASRRRSAACRAKGESSMCDYSLDLIASRPAKVGDELITTKFENSMTRGFAAIGEPSVAVCVLPGTEIAFENEVEYERFFTLLPNIKLGTKLARFRQINVGRLMAHHDALEFPDGETVLLTRMCEGQHATVLQLPASGRPVNAADEQKRDSLVR